MDKIYNPAPCPTHLNIWYGDHCICGQIYELDFAQVGDETIHIYTNAKRHLSLPAKDVSIELTSVISDSEASFIDTLYLLEQMPLLFQRLNNFVDWSEVQLKIEELGVLRMGGKDRLFCEAYLNTQGRSFELWDEEHFVDETYEALMCHKDMGEIFLKGIFEYRGFNIALVEIGSYTRYSQPLGYQLLDNVPMARLRGAETN